MNFDDGLVRRILDVWKRSLVRAASEDGASTHPIDRACEAQQWESTADVRRGQAEIAWRTLEQAHPDAPRRQFLLVWRTLRDELVAADPGWAYPQTRERVGVTIWDHLDDVARAASSERGGHGPAFLSFSLGPVQSFIAAARSVRDLWTGSYLLAYLTYRAMTPVLETCGPSAVIFPSLRRMPLIDLWLEAQNVFVRAESLEALIEQRLTPSLPNRLLAVVPAGLDGELARDLAAECERACHDAWTSLAEKVRRTIETRIFGTTDFRDVETAGWDRFWGAQVAPFFEIRATTLPWNAREAERLGQLVPEAARARAGRDNTYAARVALQFGLLDAVRAVRHVPPYDARDVVEQSTSGSDRYPQKCSILGTYEQMGPSDLALSRAFWEAFAKGAIKGSRTRPGERLCAVSLVKRFAWPAALEELLGLESEDRRFADTATIAARDWLAVGEPIDPLKIREAHGRWSGQWLHGREDEDEGPPDGLRRQIRGKSRAAPNGQGPPPTYFAALALDGDHMGRWIQGKYLPDGEVLGPETHASISAALNHYAVLAVPRIVREHSGELIYAGGDDVLAFMPTAKGLGCAMELRAAFSNPWIEGVAGGDRPHTLGSRAAMSGGLVVAHYSEDLRVVLDEARRAEKRAKNRGRDALSLSIMRRSGEHSSVVVPWSAVTRLLALVDLFANGATNRWTYTLRSELPTLRGLPREAVRAEVDRLVGRIEEADHRGKFESWVRSVFDELIDEMEKRAASIPRSDQRHSPIDAFVELCQAAAFLARGRDER